jgi:hypothetical protein
LWQRRATGIFKGIGEVGTDRGDAEEAKAVSGAERQRNGGRVGRAVYEQRLCAEGIRLRRSKKCGAGGGSRTLMGLLNPADFQYRYGFRRPKALSPVLPVCGLDYPFTSPGGSGA